MHRYIYNNSKQWYTKKLSSNNTYQIDIDNYWRVVIVVVIVQIKESTYIFSLMILILTSVWTKKEYRRRAWRFVSIAEPDQHLLQNLKFRNPIYLVDTSQHDDHHIIYRSFFINKHTVYLFVFVRIKHSPKILLMNRDVIAITRTSIMEVSAVINYQLHYSSHLTTTPQPSSKSPSSIRSSCWIGCLNIHAYRRKCIDTIISCYIAFDNNIIQYLYLISMYQIVNCVYGANTSVWINSLRVHCSV